MNEYLDALAPHLRLLAPFVARYALPFAAFALVGRGLPASHRLVAIALYAGAFGLSAAQGIGMEQLLYDPYAALLYFAVCSVLVHGIAEWHREERIGKGVTFALCAFLFVAAPAILWPRSWGVVTPIIGWEIMFSSFSYCVDTKRDEAPPSIRDCTFFLLVNPVLVFRERGHPDTSAGAAPRGVLRAFAGVLTVLGYHAIYAALALLPSLATMVPADVRTAGDYPRFLLAQVAYLLATYFGQSGRASLQIGLMALAGWRVPERYRTAILAGNLSGFWRRWNIYLANWARAYLFRPLALRFGRRVRVFSPRARVALSVMATFAAIGALHDYSLLARGAFSWPPPATVVFLLHGALLLLSIGGGVLMTRLRFPKALRGALAWAAFAHAILFTQFVSQSALSGEGLPSFHRRAQPITTVD